MNVHSITCAHANITKGGKDGWLTFRAHRTDSAMRLFCSPCINKWRYTNSTVHLLVKAQTYEMGNNSFVGNVWWEEKTLIPKIPPNSEWAISIWFRTDSTLIRKDNTLLLTVNSLANYVQQSLVWAGHVCTQQIHRRRSWQLSTHSGSS